MQLAAAHQRQAASLGADQPPGDEPPEALTYQDLLDRVRTEQGEAVLETWRAQVRGWAQDPSLDVPTLTHRALRSLVQRSGMPGPLAVVGFSSLYYPAVQLGQDGPSRRLRTAVQETVEQLASQQVTLSVQNFFPFISDMSFVGQALHPESPALVEAQTPAALARFPGTEARMNIPTVNIGPWGRDYHQPNERVYAPYAFGMLPEVLWQLTRRLLQPQAGVG